MKNKIEKIYENRQKFVVIGLTGKTGSGCSTVAEILEKGYESYNPVDFNQKELQNRKANIINKFASINFKEDDKKFKIIKPSTILIMLFLFDNKIIIEKIRIFYNLLKMTTYEINNKYTDGKKEEDNIKKYEEDLNKELKEINELFAIIKLLKKDFLSFRSFSKGLKNISILNKEKFEKEIIKIKDFYEKKLIKETKENLIDSLKNIFNLEKEFDF
jgi:dCMP deaminase